MVLIMKIPKQEKRMVAYIYDGIKRYIATQHSVTKKFCLYKLIDDDDYERLKTAESPVKFEEVIKKDRGE